jgi:ankyrin repeat protein
MCYAILKAKGTKANIYNSDYNVPLVYLVKKLPSKDVESGLAQYFECMNLCLEKGVDINCRNKFGESPLHYAAMSCNVEAADFILRHGGNVNATNKFVEPSPFQIMNEFKY